MEGHPSGRGPSRVPGHTQHQSVSETLPDGEALLLFNPVFACLFAPHKMVWAEVIFPYSAKQDGDLALSEGELVFLIERTSDSGWWTGEKEDGSIGSFPINFVKVLPPDPSFERYEEMKGISSLSIIQYEQEQKEPMKNGGKCG